MTHPRRFTSHSEVSCSGSGLPGSQLYLRNFSRRKCGCSVPGPLSNLGKRVHAVRAEPGANWPPISMQSKHQPRPLASNKPSQLQKQARKPEEYSLAQVMINWQHGGPGGHSDSEKVSPSYLKCRGPGRGPGWGLILGKRFLPPPGCARFKDQTLSLPLGTGELTSQPQRRGPW